MGDGRNREKEGKGREGEAKEEENDKICRQNSSQFKIISTLNRTTRETGEWPHRHNYLHKTCKQIILVCFRLL